MTTETNSETTKKESVIQRPLPKCGICHATGVRIYRDYGMMRREERDRCNECIDQEYKGWMVPCCLDADGQAWGYGAIPDLECEIFFSLPEKTMDKPHWQRGSEWSDSKY